RRRGDLADDVNLPRGDQRLDRDTGLGIRREQRIEDRVADGVADLVGVALGYRLTGKQPRIAHGSIPFRNLVSRIISLPCCTQARTSAARNPFAQADAFAWTYPPLLCRKATIASTIRLAIRVFEPCSSATSVSSD